MSRTDTRPWEVPLYKSDLVRGGAKVSTLSPNALDRLACAALATLEGHGVAHLTIASLQLDVESARGVARAIVAAVGARLRRAWQLEKLEVETDRVQRTDVPAGFHTRTLLPHHDAAHSSFLTPSRLDCPDIDWRSRQFAARGYTNGASHKLYQGIFIEDKGSGKSITSYYPLIPILTMACRKHGVVPTIPALAAFLARNIEGAHKARQALGSRYLTLAAALGADDPVFLAVAPHCAEADLPKEYYGRFPCLRSMSSDCGCGHCPGPTGRFFCASLIRVLGLGWLPFKECLEWRIKTNTHDLLLANNLTLLHGGIDGAPDRLLRPICLVLPEPRGYAYEHWLAESWRSRHLGALIPQLQWPQQ
jgi:hypothetical protein